MHQKAQNLHGEMTNTIQEQIRNVDMTFIHFGRNFPVFIA